MTDAPTPWERRTEVPLGVLAVLFVAGYAWPILDPGLPPWSRRACEVAVWGTWAIFAADFVVRLHQARPRGRWLLRHLLDVAILVLPMLRPLRVVRAVSALRVLNRATARGLRGRVGVYVAAGTSLLAFLAAVAVLDAERGAPDANITSFGDALWWACATMSTVGYGDRFPVTGEGRMVGVALMVGGIALLGTVTATLASWLVQSVAAETAEALEAEVEAEIRTTGPVQVELGPEVADLRLELAALREEIASLRGELPPGRPGPA